MLKQVSLSLCTDIYFRAQFHIKECPVNLVFYSIVKLHLALHGKDTLQKFSCPSLAELLNLFLSINQPNLHAILMNLVLTDIRLFIPRW